MRDLCAAVVESAGEPFVILDLGLRVSAINSGFERAFGVTRDEIEGRFLYDFAAGRWRSAGLRRLLEEELSERDHVEGFVLDRAPSNDGHGPILVNARRVTREGSRAAFIVLSMRPGGAEHGER